jgi:hypothetical protein
MLSVFNAECLECSVSLILSVTNKTIMMRVCMLGVIMVNVVMLNVIYAECHLCKVSLMLIVFNPQCHI